MNKKTRKTLIGQLETEQKRARVRTLTADEVIDLATEVETFLRRKTTPLGTRVHSCWARVAAAYKYPPAATFVSGWKREDGIKLSVFRSSSGFGNRDYTVWAPSDYIIRGPHAHSSGATDDLLTTKIVKRDND